ncbi:hypothetical protein [Corynebacterium lizhenjunii]|uniref:hypothetical protein n=1 Tax=Corynebacterium lizhenjunii TaxID=2709394 RepID=UPI0013EC8CF9|nr:hypothetical protein [Corynebacterium lizhenjunii]
MLSKLSTYSAYAVAGLIVVGSALTPFVLPLLAIAVVPGVELNHSPDTLWGWCALLIGAAVLAWLTEMVTRWVRLQTYVIPAWRPYSAPLSALVEIVLLTAVFHVFISSLPIAFLCAVLGVVVAVALERKFDYQGPDIEALASRSEEDR